MNTRRSPAGRLPLAAMALASLAQCPRAGEPGRETTVGMPARVGQLVLPGPELEVSPIADLKTPVVVRITDVYPHGSAFRYDLVYYGLKPGDYDLSAFLRRKDGTPATGLPAVPVTVRAVLPPGRVEPNPVRAAEVGGLGGYRRRLELGAMAWSAGLVVILYLTRTRPAAAVASGESRPATLADRLRPLVEEAVAGRLGPGRHAELERLLIGYWRRRLGLERADPAAAMAALRRHETAGPLVRQLEDWLHRPGGAAGVDVAALLRPYQGVPDDEPGDAAAGPVPTGAAS